MYKFKVRLCITKTEITEKPHNYPLHYREINIRDIMQSTHYAPKNIGVCYEVVIADRK